MFPVSNSIQVAGLTPPYVFLARDKFKMNVLESSIDKFPSIQQGIGVQVKPLQDRPDWLRRLLRVKARAARFFHDNEKETWRSWRGCGRAISRLRPNGTGAANRRSRRAEFPPKGEIKESLADEAQLLKLTESVPPVRIFDFTLQRAVNRDWG